MPMPLTLIASGRGSSNTSTILQQIFALLGKEKPVIAYVGVASGDNVIFFHLISRSLKAAGAGKVQLVPLVKKKADVVKAKAMLTAADVIFISGGDVEAGMHVLTERGIIPFLVERYQAGVPFIGVSAGSIMLGSQWIRWRDPDDDSTAELFPCLGLAPFPLDTHAEEDDWVELKALMSRLPAGSVGYGVPTNGALVVDPAGKVRMEGVESVKIVS